MITFFIGLGSNVGDTHGETAGRRDNVEKALAVLEKKGVKILRRSKVYETEPVGYTDQPWFLNMAATCEIDERKLLGENGEGGGPVAYGKDDEAEGQSNAIQLVELFQKVEKEVGRTETLRWGPRVIDIDLLLLGHDGEVCVTSQNLTVPHKHLHERKFVLVPLAEIAPELKHPVLGKTVLQLLKEQRDTAIVRPL